MYLAIGITFLFLGTCINSSVAIDNVKKSSNPISSGNILYVGGSGPNNYTKIQDAVDNASDGDTVFVYNGTYFENIVIDKSINLIGWNRYTTIIDGQNIGNVVSIFSEWVNISKFTIQKCGSNGNKYGILVSSDHNFISNNNIANNVYGISVNYNSNNIIISNNISNNKYGLNIYNSNNNTVKDNTISLNIGYGIWLQGRYSNNNTIIGNNISYNGIGIFVDAADHNIITRNLLTWNTYGIDYLYCIDINEISCNYIINNEYGISFYLNFYGNITNNNISYNSKCGIEFRSVYHINVEDNNIVENELGIGIYDCGHIFVRKNNFIKNKNHTDIFLICLYVKYVNNYWDDWIGVKIKFPFFQRLPKIIWYNYKLRIKIDWHPAKEPYDIEV